jgi:hypothetical protein
MGGRKQVQQDDENALSDVTHQAKRKKGKKGKGEKQLRIERIRTIECPSTTCQTCCVA